MALTFMTTTLRHFLLALLSIIVLSHLTPSFGETIKNTSFGMSHLCSNTFTGTKSVHVRSKLDCATVCSMGSACTAYSYLPDRTCNLHEGHMTSTTCSESVTSAEYFKKVPNNPCQNGGTLNIMAGTCICSGGYVGDFCERLMVDCSEADNKFGYSQMNGIYQALPTGASAPIQLQCYETIHHIVLERWIGDLDFNLTMAEYVSGFGVAGYDYWIGLENLHLVTSNPFNYILGIQLNNVSNESFYQRYYSNFKVKGADEGYSMTFSFNYHAVAPARYMGDCLTALKGLPFSTYDVDNDKNASRNCADEYGGGWWYGPDCSLCNLVGELRWNYLTRIPGYVSEVFWPDMDPPDLSPSAMKLFLYRQ